ncbi:hypothetical protein CBM2638_B40047 [Cupriavidus taiwanensis]|nr:hypothetical protein CBM2638_B40047 [Cupriavidus taiwanensis]
MDPTAAIAATTAAAPAAGATADSATVAAHQSPAAAPAAQPDPADARQFAQMVQQGRAADGSRTAHVTQAADPTSTTLGNAIRASYVSAGEESARQAARLQELRDGMFASIYEGSTSEVVYQAMLLQTQSLELFSSIHVTSSIGSAGTNLFNSLLKNQQ